MGQRKIGANFIAFFARIFSTFWQRKLDIENEGVILNLLEKFQLDSAEFTSWKGTNRNSVTSLMDVALSKGIFGVPTFVFEEEIFWGSEKLELVKARATGDYSNLI